MRMEKLLRSVAGGASLVALLLTLAPSIQAEESPQCAKLLTQAKLDTATGETFSEVSDPVVYAEGFTLCSFFAAKGTKSVMLTFHTLPAIQDGMFPTETVAEYFDMNVQSAEDTGGTKGKPLKGIGIRAVLFTEPERLRAYVETKQGFAELVATGLTGKQFDAVAKAAFAP